MCWRPIRAPQRRSLPIYERPCIGERPACQQMYIAGSLFCISHAFCSTGTAVCQQFLPCTVPAADSLIGYRQVRRLSLSCPILAAAQRPAMLEWVENTWEKATM